MHASPQANRQASWPPRSYTPVNSIEMYNVVMEKYISMKQLNIIFGMVSLLLFAVVDIAYAKRGYHVPPPYMMRVFYSFITLFPVSLFLAALSYYSIRSYDKDSCKKRASMFALVFILLAFIGSFWSAIDGHNDELWSPYGRGAYSIGLIIPVAVLLLTTKLKIWHRLMITALLIVPSYFLAGILGNFWQFAGMSLGIPTTW